MNKQQYDTEMGGKCVRFPTTHWTLLATHQGDFSADHQTALNFLIKCYWKPVYCYIRRRGYGNEEAKDLVQEFFTSWFLGGLAKRADSTRGRFRSFLLSSLDNFLSNAHRAEHAQRRRPTAGIVSIDHLASDSGINLEPIDKGDPAEIFQRTWIIDLLIRVLDKVKDECAHTEKSVHFELFHRRIITPALEGGDPPSLFNLALEYNLTEKQASNRLLTVRRAYQRLLREEVRYYAASEDDATAEVRDLFLFLSK